MARFTQGRDYGVYRLSLNDQPLGEPVDLFNPQLQATSPRVLGEVQLDAGEQALAIEAIGFPHAENRGDMLFGLDYIKLERIFNEASWTDWEIMGMQTKTVDASGLNLLSGTDARMVIDKLSFQAGDYPLIEVTMRSDHDVTAQVFFATASKPMSEESSISFPVKASQTIKTFTIDCSANPLWTGTISALRFDPTWIANDKIEIKSIRLVARKMVPDNGDGKQK